MKKDAKSMELPGLRVNLDKLVYHRGGLNLPEHQPHAFVYFFTITNDSDRQVTLLGRKWVIDDETGKRTVVEGDKIVGQTPVLNPGESFSYNSFHVTATNASAVGSFHGIDAYGNPVFVRIPPFEMVIPPHGGRL